MSKKLFLFLGAAVLLLIIGSWTFYANRVGIKSPVGEVVRNLIPKTQGEELYEDEAGFSFKHPRNTDVKDITPDDGDFYSLLEISSNETNGRIIISVRDTKFEKVSSWSEEELKGSTLAGAVSLGNIPASEYSLLKEGDKFQVTAGIQDRILYEITSPADNDFWEKAVDLIISTFTSVQTSTATTGTNGGEDVIYEEEEVVE